MFGSSTLQVLENITLLTVAAVVLNPCIQLSLWLGGCLTAFMLTQCMVLIIAQPHRNNYTKTAKSFYRCGEMGGLLNILLVPLAVTADHVALLRQDKGNMIDCREITFILVSTSSIVTAAVFELKGHGATSVSRTVSLLPMVEGFAAVWLLPFIFNLDALHLSVTLSLSCAAFWATRHVPSLAPCSFSLAEASVCVHLTSLMLWRILTWLLDKDLSGTEDVHIVSALGVTGVVVAVGLLALTTNKVAGFFFLFATIALTWVLPSFVFLLEVNPFVWLWRFISLSWHRLRLFARWLLLVGVAVLVTAAGSRLKSTGGCLILIIRKVFHLLAVGVFLLGLSSDLPFLFLASLTTWSVFIVVEVVRLYQIPPFGKTLCGAFEIFRDDQDQGRIILTNIYLLTGLSLPLWLTSSLGGEKAPLPLWAGVIALGIGDASASVCGFFLGKHRWPGSKKTLEGSLCSLICQIFFIRIIIAAGLVDSWPPWSSVLTVILTTLHEATLSQIDNLMLPLTAFTLLSVGRTTL